MAPTLISQHGCFGGTQSFWQHPSSTIGLPMKLGVFTPPQARSGPVPALIYLAGLTCNEETFALKAGAQQWAAHHDLMLVTPDTSPRQTGVAGADTDWDFGNAAGFYLDATQMPWAPHWRMESYITQELTALLGSHFAADLGRLGIFGHSMGGHGALTLALRHPRLFRSVSALAPIASPTRCPWGIKALGGYLGNSLDIQREVWPQHDACRLIEAGARTGPLLVDQGLDDKFLADQLHPHLLEQACRATGQPLTLRRHEGYDHGYYFVSSFLQDHVAHHAAQLSRPGSA